MKDIEFKRPELEDRELISSYFEKAPSRSCERTFANVYLWSRRYHVRYAVIEGALVFMDDEDGLMFAYPAGEPEAVKRALEFLKSYSEERGCSLKLYNVTEENFAQMDSWYPGKYQIEYDRDEADYVYETEKLATLAGKKLHGKRNPGMTAWPVARGNKTTGGIHSDFKENGKYGCKQLRYPCNV